MIILDETSIHENSDVQSTPHKRDMFIPKYQKLFDKYKGDILSHRLEPGSRIDSINDIQKNCEVSRETAKLVLKRLAHEGFIIQRPGMGSFVADLSPSRKIWAAVLPFYSVHYEYLLQILAEKALLAGREFKHFIDYNSWQEEVRLVGQLINERYEAVIVVPTLDESNTADFYSRLSPASTIVALMDHTMAGSFFPYAIQSYDLGVQRGMRYLMSKKEGAIAFVRNEVWADRNMVQFMMEETYKSILSTDRPNQMPIVFEKLKDVSAEYLKSNSITGLFCCDDSDAIRIIGRLKENGIAVPRDVSLVSYGNTELAQYFTPAITSINPHSHDMASYIVNILESRINGGDTALDQFVVQPDLVVRET
jgi:DNA-binding LacI/PurR family transcriptional regulator